MKNKIGCIGTGNMGSAIIRAICKEFGSENVIVSNRSEEKGRNFAKETGCKFTLNNVEVVKNSDYVFLAVKPNMIQKVIQEISGEISENQVLISMAAGLTIENLVSFCDSKKNVKFIRIMPNVPAQIGQAMTALCCNDDISLEQIQTVTKILESAGKVEKIPESLMDCVTAVSGSGPAFVFMFIEALADAAVKCGMPRSQAYVYAAQTVKGSAQMVLETKIHPAVLKDSVCSPGGTTIEGVSVLEREGFRNSVIQAVVSANNKSKGIK